MINQKSKTLIQMMLKENYERLIQIHKKSESNKKDREYALEAQNEELRLGYEKLKAENIKLDDNLDTQNKLWKMWIMKFEDSSNHNSKEQNKKEDDEILLIEDEDTHDDIEDEETEIIFQNYLNNLKQSGFRRRNPVEEADKHRSRTLKCITIAYCSMLSTDNTITTCASRTCIVRSFTCCTERAPSTHFAFTGCKSVAKT